MAMRYFLDIAGTGLAAVRLHPLRSAVSFVVVVSVLLPYLAGLGLSQGVQAEAEASVQFGADLYVTGSRFGRPVPLPLAALPSIRRLEGVTDVVPRIVGAVVLGRGRVHAVLVGLPPERCDAWSDSIEGELPQTRSLNELVIGTTLARKLNLKIGAILPPFYRNDREGAHLSRVVGIFRPDAPLWQANLILTTFETAAHIFDQRDLATDLLVWCRPDAAASITRTLEENLSLPAAGGEEVIRPLVTARQDLLALLPRGLLHREGMFNLLFLLAFVNGFLVLLVTSGIGRGERRREIGILKATGWQTDEILLRGLVESAALGLASACVALLLAWAWLRLFNGYGIAGLFLDGAEAVPSFRVPYRLTPVPALLAFVVAFAVVLLGTLSSCWRAAVTPPREAMR
jgi:ABC-type lipoprotein release transport system permease subunit